MTDTNQAQDLVPFHDSDSAVLLDLIEAHSRGVRIMTTVLIGGGAVVISAIGLAAVFTNSVGPVVGITGAIYAFLVFISVTSRKRMVKLKQDVASGVKLSIEATILKKEVTGNSGEGVGGQYFLHLDGQRFWVDVKAYTSVEEGDRVLFEYLVTSELVLRITSSGESVEGPMTPNPTGVV